MIGIPGTGYDRQLREIDPHPFYNTCRQHGLIHCNDQSFCIGNVELF